MIEKCVELFKRLPLPAQVGIEAGSLMSLIALLGLGEISLENNSTSVPPDEVVKLSIGLAAGVALLATSALLGALTRHETHEA